MELVSYYFPLNIHFIYYNSQIASSNTSLLNNCTGFTIKFNSPICTLADGTDCSANLPSLSSDGVNCLNVVKMVS